MSISLVLFLVGLECVMLMSARELIRYVRENVVLTIVLQEGTTADELTRMQCVMTSAPYVLDFRYISKEEALQEHIDNFGLDKEVLKYFPDAQIAVLPHQLNGPVLTCLTGLSQVELAPDEALLINDCDHMLRCDELAFLVENSDEGVEKAFRLLLDGKVPMLTTDYKKYNENAIAEFKALIK